jgi:hypothetical protein
MPRIPIHRPNPIDEMQRMITERLAFNIAERYGFTADFLDKLSHYNLRPMTAAQIAMRGAEVCAGICQPHRKHVESRIVEPKQLSSG